MTLETVRALARDYARAVRTHWGARVHQVWLYGSAARGDWTPDSDIDILVVLDNEGSAEVEWLVATAYRMGLLERRILLQPVVMTPAHFEHLRMRERRFALDILREGVAL